MKQYFYLVAHTDLEGGVFIDKIFLQEHDAIKWGRRLAKNPDYIVKLYKQEITRTGKLEFVKPLRSFYLTPEDAINLASEHHLEAEVRSAMDSGMSPLEACREWDLI